MNSRHHVHVFASNLDESLEFYTSLFDAVVVADLTLAGARNVFMKIGGVVAQLAGSKR